MQASQLRRVQTIRLIDQRMDELKERVRVLADRLYATEREVIRLQHERDAYLAVGDLKPVLVVTNRDDVAQMATPYERMMARRRATRSETEIAACANGA